ncbi:PH domain-containing protein [Streptomyces glaucescens]|uniref:Integral membrane protein n=1 Tax=Streptomyces glaucescens TaxID=1907 RepID=A0A089XAB7_STRGA|nr:PH domain-containing protein [Streptomyces glaucescens]AIS00189.1 integral membrane protein [Streptomyces glaucescens]
MTTTESKDRIYRSPAGIAGGVLLLGLAAWLGIDAIVAGDGRTPWVALATLLLVLPLITAFTLRPAVAANDDRLRIRNPFRVVVLPWGEVASLRSGYTNEVVAKSGRKYQLWAVPVSLRARKKAARRESRRAAELSGERGGRERGLGGLAGFGGGAAVPEGPVRAQTDQIMDELRELLEARETAEAAQGQVTVRWAYEIVAPAVAGAVLLGVLLGLG